MLERVAVCTLALTRFLDKLYDERSASVFFQIDSGEWTKPERSRGVQRRDTMGLALFGLPLKPMLTRVRERY